MYREAAAVYGEMPAFATRIRRKQWRPTSFRELYQTGIAVATALIDLGVRAREHVGVLADNRLEWIVTDYAIQLCGAVNVPRGRDVTDGEIRYILNHAKVAVVFVETVHMQERVLRLRAEVPGLREIVLMDASQTPAKGVRRLESVIQLGRELRAEGDRRAEGRIEAVRPDDLFTLIYTSGTTGEPKGVMLTHTNMISQLESIPLPVTCTDRIVSILPVWHIFERVFEMLAISRGCCTYYSSVRSLSEDMSDVEPTFMGSAPRMWEGIHQRILKRVKTQHPVRRALFHAAYSLSRLYKGSVFYLTDRELDTEGRSLSRKAVLTALHGLRWLVLLAPYGFFNAAVLERLRLVVGGAFKGSVSGGGALSREVDEFFNFLGIPVLEGYGLTETAPVVAVRTPKRLVIGTVGPVIPGTQVRIVCLESGRTLYPDPSRRDGGRGLKGEIAVCGPQVMSGYYRQSGATDAAIRDGWFHTGDIGMVTFNDCLRIMGRCKETIVLANGENIDPAPIEICLGQSDLIEQCMLVGQDRRYLGALIVPSVEGFVARGVQADSLETLAKMPEARRLMGDELRALVSPGTGFKAYERIGAFRLLPKPFEVGRELTNLFKLKRHVVSEDFREEIEDLYGARRTPVFR